MPHNFRKFQCLLLAACLAAGMAGLARAGQVSFSTYYPAPFGIYDRLRLPPRPALGSPCDPGTFYYEAGAGLKLCNETAAWGPFGGGVWTQSGNNIYPSDTATNPNLNVGIGTTNPAGNIHVYDNTSPGSEILIDGGWGGRAKLSVSQISGTPFEISHDWGIQLHTLDTSNVDHYMAMDRNGNVGIGTTAPNNSIQVKDLINFDNARGGTALGYQAGQIDAGSQNAFLGFQAGQANTTGSANTASGFRALQSNTTGWNNVAIGYQALQANTTGNANTASGMGALLSNTTGGSNTANGYGALQANTTGNANTASGLNALFSNTTGNSNTASGTYALVANTTGWSNVANGGSALAANTTGVENVANGYRSLYSNTIGNDNTANGNYSLYDNTTGGANVANGANALFKNTTGNTNTANGTNSLYSNTTGSGNVANGYESLSVNTTGNYNTAIGYQAGFAPITGNSNVFIGYQAGYLETGSNKLYIANSSVNPPLIYGDFSTGNVGIGTVSPLGPLTIDNTTGSPWVDVRSNGDANNYSAISLWSNEGGSWASPDKRWGIGHQKLASEKNNFFIEECNGNCLLGNPINYAQRLTIKPGGNVGIGVTSPTERLDVNGNVKATAFFYSSDRNLKEDIQPLSPDVLEKVLQLQGVSYTWKDGGNKSIGLIAQDVEKIFPELVSTDPATGLKSLQYAGLTGPLIEALKQQQIQIDELKAQIKELQTK